MKPIYLLILITFYSVFSYAQQDSAITKPWKTPFKRGYIRLGIHTLGGSLDTGITPFENIKKGNLGAKNGYSLEFGHIFYFLGRKEPRIFNVGLDWTILSLNYSPLDKWKDYAVKRAEDPDLDELKMAAAVISRLGPVIAVNPADKLVIEARFQVNYGLYLPVLDYSIYEGVNTKYSFWFNNDNYFESRGVGTGFGATVRYGFFGFSADWVNANIPTAYSLQIGNNPEINGTEKISYKYLKIGVNFSF